ncbi:MAG: hypothetical protein BWY82_01707 [Verrucomicrobia bacterium ADurb.Bin474]|nr:MAG: hypothetical protein BWY82_01707 [Verrucomicrobia bacterium ADurb.Bin474]
MLIACRFFAGRGHTADEINQRIGTGIECRHMDWPVVHLNVDVRVVIAVPWSVVVELLLFVVKPGCRPKALQVCRK